MTQLAPSTTTSDTNEPPVFHLSSLFRFLREFINTKAVYNTLVASDKHGPESAQRVVDSLVASIELSTFDIPVTGPGPTLRDFIGTPGATVLAAATIGTVNLLVSSREIVGGATLDDCVAAIFDFALGVGKLMGVDDGQEYEQLQAGNLDSLLEFMDKLIDGSLSVDYAKDSGNGNKSKGTANATNGGQGENESQTVAVQSQEEEQEHSPRPAQDHGVDLATGEQQPEQAQTATAVTTVVAQENELAAVQAPEEQEEDQQAQGDVDPTQEQEHASQQAEPVASNSNAQVVGVGTTTATSQQPLASLVVQASAAAAVPETMPVVPVAVPVAVVPPVILASAPTPLPLTGNQLAGLDTVATQFEVALAKAFHKNRNLRAACYWCPTTEQVFFSLTRLIALMCPQKGKPLRCAKYHYKEHGRVNGVSRPGWAVWWNVDILVTVEVFRTICLYKTQRRIEDLPYAASQA
ncbi:hypothetical protein BCR44DRAFT_31525 [Catenaria anguillulae PL171]|uniref:Uncharacterized protein n=1 Tax=Catenaria anguillulae PL171 TaxID=765915 RepID=A0A1Y2HFY6_9FUNG|nr:hypothetical protein BCR44DRAFT_31525 [Catenaria anguillulae PL171]